MITEIIHLALWPVFIAVCWFAIRFMTKRFEKNRLKSESEN